MRPDEPGHRLPPEIDASPLPSGLVDGAGDWVDTNPALRTAAGDAPPALGALLDEPGLRLADVLADPRSRTLRATLPSGASADAVVAGAATTGSATRLVQLVDRSDVRRLEALADAAATATAVFVARVSHDLRNPIGTANGYAQLLLEDDALGEESRSFVERIVSSSVRALDTITEIVTETRSSAAVARPDAIDLRELTGEVSTELAALLDERGASVTVAGELPTVRADRTDLRRSLLALVRNAVEHHPGAAHVEVSAVATEAGWEVVVSDDGAGVSGEDRDALVAGTAQVSGFGLRLTRSAMVRHGGRLELEDGPAGGLVARLVLPQRRLSDPPRED